MDASDLVCCVCGKPATLARWIGDAVTGWCTEHRPDACPNCAKLRAEVARLRAVLKPFAEAYGRTPSLELPFYDNAAIWTVTDESDPVKVPVRITVQHLRDAHATLEATDGK